MTSQDEWLDRVGEGPARDLPALLVHQRVAQHAAERPTAIAVRHRDATLTYAELDRRANQLAHTLAARGLGVGARVVVCLEPGLEIAVALLGVLKAGAVYIPLDPGYPPARIAAILDDTRPQLVLARAAVVARLGLAELAVPRLVLDDEADAAALAAEPTHDPARAVPPSQPASVYFTSGTTGRPKGVLASHANVLTYIQIAQDRYGIGPDEVMPAIARFGFSISMFELMSPLYAGGTLVVLDREVVLDPARLADALADVTFFHAGPSLLRNLLPAMRRQPAERYAKIRHASSGGDLIAPELLRGLCEQCPNAEVFVIYGCSEISCMGCTYPVPREPPVTRTFVGRPMGTVAVAVLDPEGRRVPAGEVGEVWFAGGGVVLGYLDRPELTAERFVERDGRRWYRTGDVGRWSADGWLELLGREDFQVKVRGMRIELGEIEHHLRRMDGVRDAVVAGWPGPDGEMLLCAYVVPQPGADEAGRKDRLAAVRRHLAEQLPDYMVPARYVELAALPLNHNLKVDRRALPAPVTEVPSATELEPARAPRTETERALAALWARILDVPVVARDDHFFELGGDSLRGLELRAAVTAALGVELAGLELVREPLAVLAALCDARRGTTTIVDDAAAAAPPAAVPTTFYFGPDASLYGVLHGPPRADVAVLVCAPLGQEGARAHFVLSRLARRLAATGVPCLRFDVFGSGDSLGDGPLASPQRWIDDIVAAHAELRARTGAKRVIAVGARLGATLAARAAEHAPLARLVVWDPVLDGAGHVAELRQMQHAYERSTQRLRGLRRPAQPVGVVELAGSRFTDGALRELAALTLSSSAAPLAWLVTSAPARQAAAFAARGGGTQRVLAGSVVPWADVARWDDTFPDVGVSAALAALVLEAAP